MEKRKATYAESVLALLFMVVFVFVGISALDLPIEPMMLSAAGWAGILGQPRQS